MEDKASHAPEIHSYIGTKIVKAYPETKDNIAGHAVIYPDGYKSWSPDEAFEAYQRLPGPLSFSHALFLCRQGKKIARAGWNGKDMYVVYQKAYPEGIPINKNTAEATGLPEGTLIRFLPYLMMRTVDGSFVPWLISQTDALSDDWYILE
jgi:hypothetical protein